MKSLLYSAEVLIGYGPVLTLWLIGVGMGLPFSVAAMINGEILGFQIFSAVVLGSIGIWGVIQIIKKLIWPETGYKIGKYRNHLFIGCLSVAIAATGFWGVSYLFMAYLVAPILVTLHLYNVCKKYS